jgi:hypothetical protein
LPDSCNDCASPKIESAQLVEQVADVHSTEFGISTEAWMSHFELSCKGTSPLKRFSDLSLNSKNAKLKIDVREPGSRDAAATQPNRSDDANYQRAERTEFGRIFAQLSPLMWAYPFPVPSGRGHCDNSGCIQIASASGAAH